jgi:beta-phosphoglucomutase-like phosphatase (HAD superfamily)
MRIGDNEMIFIYDLDGTVIDSSHRYQANENGTVNLEHWRSNSTPSKIMQDKIMPLAKHMRDAFKMGHTVIISTARVMKAIDHSYLVKHKLNSHYLLAREGETDLREGHIQKEQQLKSLGIDLKKAVMFEDNSTIREHLNGTLGIHCINPQEI